MIIFIFLILTNIQTQPFDSLKISAFSNFNINSNNFTETWMTDYSLSLDVNTDYYYGHFGSGFFFTRFNSPVDSVTDFKNIFFYGYYGLSLSIKRNLLWSNDIGIGYNLMIFDDENDPGLKQESEMGILLKSNFEYPVFRNFKVDLSIEYITIFTNDKIELGFISFGLSYIVSSTNFVRSILQ